MSECFSTADGAESETTNPFSTAFTATARHVRQLLKKSTVDEEALSRSLKRCDLASCHGTCCHDGVYLNPDEARTIGKLATDFADFFNVNGIELPANPVVRGSSQGVSGLKTATKPVQMDELAEDYPQHFELTNCVFLMDDARCSLQLLSEELGEHPWHYKPFTCWMHPLSIDNGELTIHSRENDPQNLPDYPGFVSQTPCGKADSCGQPACDVLREEIDALSQIAGRDLLA